MTKETQRVKDFMKFFGQATPRTATQIDEKTAKLRAKLIIEETLELICKGLGLSICLEDEQGYYVTISEETLPKWMDEGITFYKNKEVDLEQTLDGVCDVFVVSEGTAIACGLDTEPAHQCVADSNDSKKWEEKDLEEAKKTYPTARIEDYGGGLYRLIREDGKIIKSPNYQKADLSSIVEAQKA